MRVMWIALIGILGFSSPPFAQGNFDGTWSGSAGQWGIKLTVAGAKGRMTLSCGGNDFLADIPVSADGAIDSYVTTGAGRRQITGKLPALNIPPGGSCGGGATTLTK